VTEEKEAKRIAAEIGYPVIIKASAGGGGRGMKGSRFTEADLEIALQTGAHGSGCRLRRRTPSYIEKIPAEGRRHIEGAGVRPTALAAVCISVKRDCSLQRRHQKVWEEANSPALNAEERSRHRRHLRQTPSPTSAIPAAGHDRVPL